MSFICYEDELLQSVNIKETTLRIDSISKKHKEGSVFRDAQLNIHYALMGIDLVCKDICKPILRLMPVFVVKRSKHEYVCVGNLRTLQLARIMLPKSYQIPVKVIDDSAKLIRHMALIEVLIMPMLYPLHLTRKEAAARLIGNTLLEESGKLRCNGICDWPKVKVATAVIGSINEISIETILNSRRKDFICRVDDNVRLTKNCIWLLLEMFPVIISPCGGGKYQCYGNQRVLHIAKESINCKAEIPVIKTKRISGLESQRLEQAGATLPALVYSIAPGGAPSLGKAIREVSKSDKAFLFKGTTTQAEMAGWSGYSRKSMFHKVPRTRAAKVVGVQTENLREYDIDVTISVEGGDR